MSNLKIPLRQVPLLQIQQNCRFWLNYYQKRSVAQSSSSQLKRLCLVTSRGRSVTRLTGTSRSIFRLLALKGWCSGLTRSSW